MLSAAKNTEECLLAQNRIHTETIELLLSAITMTMGDDGARHSFLYGKPGARHWEKRIGTEIFYHFVDLKLAALFVRNTGPLYLKALPISDITSKLQNFISENFWFLANETFTVRRDEPLNQWISNGTKAALAGALSNDPLFAPKNALNLFPLVPIAVKEEFRSDRFLLSSTKVKDPFGIKDEHTLSHLDPTKFPPLKEFDGPQEYPMSWLGVLSPDPRSALKIRSSILGAIALTALPHHRHMFSGRSVFGGQFTLSDDGVSCSFAPIHTPPCMHDIVITGADKAWLKLLSQKLGSTEKTAHRQMKALEYFYRAWAKEPSERFPIMCMALDAIFGDANNATQAVIGGIRETLGEHVSDPQLRLLMKLRASVIHGGAPDVYDSKKYAKYYREYQADPISELELVTSACLRKVIFDHHLVVHPDPTEHAIKEAQAEGRLPKNLTSQSILSE